MAITIATGTTVSVGSTYGSAVTMSAITNGTNPVATLAAAHGVVVGDYVEFTSGWDRLNGRIARATAVSTNDVTFAGLDTADTAKYPAGSGTGTVRRITAFTTIAQITQDIQTGGGEQNYADVTTLTDAIKKQVPTTRNPITVALPLYDDPSLAFVSTVRTAAQNATATAALFSYPNGSKLVANAYYSYQEVPTIQDSTLRSRVDLSFAALPMRYTT